MSRLRRLPAVLVTVALVATVAAACTGPGSPGGAARDTTAAAVGTVLDDTLAIDDAGIYDDLRAVLVSVGPDVVVERYFRSDPSEVGQVGSVTASVMADLIGIAVDEGAIGGLDEPLRELLPSYAGAMDRRTGSVTLREVLTMTAGFPADDDGRTLAAYDVSAADWVRSILRDGLARPPGTGFRYASAGTHLLAAILAEATGRPVLAFAREHLFGPLGIDTHPVAEPVAVRPNLPGPEAAGFAWAVDQQGRNTADFGLALTARDMLRVGRLMLLHGRWQGEQLVSRRWVAESTGAQVLTDGVDAFTTTYGYQWWVTTAGGHDAFAALGYGGQMIEVVPDLTMVVVISTRIPAVVRLSPRTFLQLVDQFIAPAVAGSAR